MFSFRYKKKNTQAETEHISKLVICQERQGARSEAKNIPETKGKTNNRNGNAIIKDISIS
jgi:hypothetical protein